MKNKFTITKFAFLLGAVIDGFWAVVMAFPSLYCLITNSTNIELNIQTRVVFIIASSLMLGWTFLLIWGYQKPVERRFVLLLTAFPVVLGIFIGTLIGLINGNLLAIIFAVKTLLILLIMVLGFIKAK